MLLKSLSLDDEEYERSADVEACRALSIIYADAPATTEDRILAAFRQADAEVKELILQIYRRFGELCREDSKKPAHAKAIAAVPMTLDRLLAFISSIEVPFEARITAAEAVQHLASDQPALVMPKCEAIFGMLALIFHEKGAFFEANPGGDPVLPGFPRAEWAHFDRITSQLARTLKELGEHSAMPVFESLAGIIRSLDSKNKAQEEFKICLVEMYETLFRDYHVGIKMVPHLFNALMDMESIGVRFAALNCISKILKRKPELVPDNMREMIKLYLKDNFVAMHKGAARCMDSYKPSSEAEAEEIAFLLCIQFKVHQKKDADSRHLGDLLDAVTHICHGNPKLLRKYAFLVILRLSRGEDSDLAEKALARFERELASVPDLAPLYVAETLEFFKRFDAGDGEFYSPTKHLLLSLYDQPLSAIEANQSKFKDLIIKLIAEDEGFTAFQILSILFHFELYQCALDISNEIEKTLPADKSHQWAINEAKLFAAAAKAESCIATGNIDAALATLDGVSTTLANYGTPSERNDPRASFEAFTVAHAAAARIK